MVLFNIVHMTDYRLYSVLKENKNSFLCADKYGRFQVIHKDNFYECYRFTEEKMNVDVQYVHPNKEVEVKMSEGMYTDRMNAIVKYLQNDVDKKYYEDIIAALTIELDAATPVTYITDYVRNSIINKE